MTEQGSNEADDSEQEYGVIVQSTITDYITIYADSREEAEQEAVRAVGDDLGDRHLDPQEFDVRAVTVPSERYEQIEEIYGSLVKQHIDACAGDPDPRENELEEARADGLMEAISQLESVLNEWADEEAQEAGDR